MDVPYANALVNCSNLHDPSSCIETQMFLDVLQPAGVSKDDEAWGHMPVVVSVHSGGFISGDKRWAPPSSGEHPSSCRGIKRRCRAPRPPPTWARRRPWLPPALGRNWHHRSRSARSARDLVTS